MSVGDIVDDVRTRGDEALREWALRLDGVEPARATPEPGRLPNAAVLALADRVRRWHEAQRPADLRLEVEPGVELERRWVPLRSVVVYVPRSLVSTLVMCALPARVAGVERIVVVTPPAGAGLVAAAAELLGLDDVWAVGGAQAIAALAYGTESIRRAPATRSSTRRSCSSPETWQSISLQGRPRSSWSSAAAATGGLQGSSSPRRPSTAPIPCAR